MPWETGAEDEVIVGRRSDVRTVTVTLSSGNMKFDWVRIVDEKGVERTTFGEGEIVAFEAKITNKGDVKDRATLIVTDEDTGDELWTYSTDLDAGRFWQIPPNDLGKMPGSDWHLRFSVSP